MQTDSIIYIRRHDLKAWKEDVENEKREGRKKERNGGRIYTSLPLTAVLGNW